MLNWFQIKIPARHLTLDIGSTMISIGYQKIIQIFTLNCNVCTYRLHSLNFLNVCTQQYINHNFK